MLAMGYSQSPPVTSSETWIVIVSMLFGCLFYMLLVAYLAMVLANLDSTGIQFDHEVCNLFIFGRIKCDLKFLNNPLTLARPCRFVNS